VEELVRGGSRRLRSRRAGPEPPVRPRLTGAWSPAAALPVRSCACPGIRISSPTRPACWMPATGTSFTGRPAVIPVAAARRVVGRDALAGVRGAVLGTGQPDAHAQRDVDQADGDRLALPWRRPVFPRRGPGSVTSPPLADTYRLPANSEPPVEDLLAAYSQMMEIPDIEVRSRAAAERVQRPGGRPRRRCLYPVGDRPRLARGGTHHHRGLRPHRQYHDDRGSARCRRPPLSADHKTDERLNSLTGLPTPLHIPCCLTGGNRLGSAWFETRAA
jgi:hypothetical protein